MNSAWPIVAAAVCAGVQPSAPPPVRLAPESGETGAATRLSERLEAVDAAMAKVIDLRANFEQRRHTPLLKKPLISKGTVLTKGNQVRWDTEVPRPSSLLIDDESIRMYYPADKLLEIYPVGEGFKDLGGAPLPRLADLRTRYDISRISPTELGASADDPNLIALLLTPTNESLKQHVASVKVLLDESQTAATRVIMTDSEGDQTELIFSNIRLNAGVRDDEVHFKVPPGVRESRPLGGGVVDGNKGDTKGSDPRSVETVKDDAPTQDRARDNR